MPVDQLFVDFWLDLSMFCNTFFDVLARLNKIFKISTIAARQMTDRLFGLVNSRDQGEIEVKNE